MRLCSPLLLCLAAALSSALVISPPHMWTKLILTHHWPSTFCSMEHCHPNISYWTLHGLWPDKGIDCNSSWHFNSSQIEKEQTLVYTKDNWQDKEETGEYLILQNRSIKSSFDPKLTKLRQTVKFGIAEVGKDLLPDMEKSWPDLLNPLSSGFWKYEWHKHGTCAAKADSLNSQHKYFSKALELYHKVDLDSILKKFDITPSEKYYSFSQIEGVIENFYGIKPKIQCVHPSKNAGVQILGQIEICFNPDFTLLDCEKQFTMETISKGNWDNPMAVDKASGFSVCDHDMPVYYPPLS